MTLSTPNLLEVLGHELVNFGDVTPWLYGHLTLPTNGNSGHTETSGSYYPVSLRVTEL